MVRDCSAIRRARAELAALMGQDRLGEDFAMAIGTGQGHRYRLRDEALS